MVSAPWRGAGPAMPSATFWSMAPAALAFGELRGETFGLSETPHQRGLDRRRRRRIRLRPDRAFAQGLEREGRISLRRFWRTTTSPSPAHRMATRFRNAGAARHQLSFLRTRKHSATTSRAAFAGRGFFFYGGLQHGVLRGGLTRVSIHLQKKASVEKRMDCRVKPGNDAVIGVAARGYRHTNARRSHVIGATAQLGLKPPD